MMSKGNLIKNDVKRKTRTVVRVYFGGPPGVRTLDTLIKSLLFDCGQNL